VPATRVQPIAADDVARALARIAIGAPVNGTIELGGPESFYLNGLIERVLGARRDPRRVRADRRSHLLGVTVGHCSLVAGDEAELGEIRFEQWLAEDAGPSLSAGVPGSMARHEFRTSDVPPGSVLLLGDVAVFSVEGGFCATQALCTHRRGALSEGVVDGSTVTCPLHGARFNVWTGAVLRGPATTPLRTYAVTIDGGVGRVDLPVVDRPVVTAK
jgi:nitrite reductase/ring-hydroxylating ferredoxin subunit